MQKMAFYKSGWMNLQVTSQPSGRLSAATGGYGCLWDQFCARRVPAKAIDECMEGLSNVAVIHGDIMVYGTGDNEGEAMQSHDVAFTALLECCRSKGLYKLDRVAYLGRVIIKDGISPDPEKVQAISDMPKPVDVRVVQRLLGVINYLFKFIPQLSTIAEPLRRLTDKESEFDW